MLGSFQAAVAKARRERSLLFASLVSEESILEAFGSARWLWQGWVYSPAVTIWVFLSQCLSMDHSCRDAVTRLITWRVARGLRPCSADTGAYCTAREGLPEAACHQLVRQTGSDLEREAPAEWLWHKRRVRVVDGSTITMPDTAANQAKYPQMDCQKSGCGFPIARIVVVFSLSVGTVLEAAIGKCGGKETGENSLFRTLQHCPDPGDVVVFDRYFSGWWDFACCRSAAWTWWSASTRFATLTSGKGSDWEKTIIWFAGPSRRGPSGCRTRPTRHSLRNSCCAKSACG